MRHVGKWYYKPERKHYVIMAGIDREGNLRETRVLGEHHATKPETMEAIKLIQKAKEEETKHGILRSRIAGNVATLPRVFSHPKLDQTKLGVNTKTVIYTYEPIRVEKAEEIRKEFEKHCKSSIGKK